MNRLYRDSRADRYSGRAPYHGADDQHLVLPSDTRLLVGQLRRQYRIARGGSPVGGGRRIYDVGALSPNLARQAVWYPLWLGSLYLDINSLQTPYLDKETS
jgi:hypothetical protein